MQRIDATVKRSGKAVLERNLAAISSEAEGGPILWFTNHISKYSPQFHVLKEILAEIFIAAWFSPSALINFRTFQGGPGITHSSYQYIVGTG